MEPSILEWLPEEETPEVRLRTLKKYEKLPESEAMQAGYEVLNRHRLENGRYLLTASKSVPAFKAGNIGEENKWVTLYACMARE